MRFHEVIVHRKQRYPKSRVLKFVREAIREAVVGPFEFKGRGARRLVSESSNRHMWTAPIGKLFLDALFDLVSFGHMYDLFARRWPLVLMKLDCRGPNHCDGFDP
jgi:hypothetical protein